MTVDYERGNFSVSQCLWNDGVAPQVVTISSPSNGTSAGDGNGSGQENKPAKKKVGTGLIIGVVVAVLVILAAAGAGLYFFLRRKRSPPPVELPALAPDIVVPVDHPTGQTPYEETQDPFLSRGHGSFPADKKPEFEMVPQELHHQRSELSTTTEIYQLADRDNREGNYHSEAQQMNSSRRVTTASELPGSAVLFELEADPVSPDARTRQLLPSPVPTFSSRHTTSTLSPTDVMLPVSPQSVAAARGQSRSPAQSDPMSWLAISPTNSMRRGFGAESPGAIPSELETHRPTDRGGTPSPVSRWFNRRDSRRGSSHTRGRSGGSLRELFSP